MRPRGFISAAFLSWGIIVACGIGIAMEGTVELGRPLKARQWLESLGQVPSADVSYQSLPIARIVPQTCDYYTIDPVVTAVGYSYFFHVSSSGTEFMVGGAGNLAKVAHELAVVDEIEKRHKGKEFARGVAEGVGSIGSGLANLVKHPGVSMKNAGARFRQMGRSIEQTVTGESIGVDASGVDRSLLGDGPAGGARRTLAYELGVDVYTSNPVLREALSALATAHAAGSFATWAVPYNLGLLANFNPLAEDEWTEMFIRDNNPYETRRTVGTVLEPIFSMSREDPGQALYAFLNNPNYSPRMVAYAGLDFQYLRDAANVELVLDDLAGASTPEEADLATLTLRMYSLFHRNVKSLVGFRGFGESVVGVGGDGVMYMMVACDTLRPWGETARAFAALLDDAHGLGAKGLEIWSMGDVHPRLVENAGRYGVSVHQNVFSDPTFFPRAHQLQMNDGQP